MGKMYKIVRFYAHGRDRLIKTGLALEEAQAHCRREDTHGDGWFEGYDDESPTGEEICERLDRDKALLDAARQIETLIAGL